ncbi:hypothetical protein HK102_012266 [Quaeritorhiza haematococci]|nr:hypothetical protein HK102_012266 [Quaeritorhiza haematococci]
MEIKDGLPVPGLPLTQAPCNLSPSSPSTTQIFKFQPTNRTLPFGFVFPTPLSSIPPSPSIPSTDYTLSTRRNPLSTAGIIGVVVGTVVLLALVVGGVIFVRERVGSAIGGTLRKNSRKLWIFRRRRRPIEIVGAAGGSGLTVPRSSTDTAGSYTVNTAVDDGASPSPAPSTPTLAAPSMSSPWSPSYTHPPTPTPPFESNPSSAPTSPIPTAQLNSTPALMVVPHTVSALVVGSQYEVISAYAPGSGVGKGGDGDVEVRVGDVVVLKGILGGGFVRVRNERTGKEGRVPVGVLKDREG